jgi:hypothetical protein
LVRIFIIARYPKFERLLYYSQSSLEEATHLTILNYDNQITIVKKTEEIYRPNQKEAHKVIGFVNRYMKYFVIDGVVRAGDFDYRKRISNVFKNPKDGLTN